MATQAATNRGRSARAGAAKARTTTTKAADQAAAENSTQISLPLIGRVSLPASDQLAFIGGLSLLAVAGVVDWPVVAAIGIGHALVQSRQSKTLHEFGEALEQA